MNRLRYILGLGSLLCVAALSGCSLLTVERIGSSSDNNAVQVEVQSTGEIAYSTEMYLLEELATKVAQLETENQLQGTHIAHLATRGPALATVAQGLPPSSPVLIVGEVEIEQGSCCIGGVAGTEIEIFVRFTAIGLEAPPTEMRYAAGSYTKLEEDLASAPWQTYSEQLHFTYQIPINWTGFYVRVQYRDSLGNLSPVYTDDISVEGAPPTTPAPGG